MTDIERAFEILGIAPTDDALVVRKAWRALVRSYHPDTARTDPVGANKRLAEINVAYDAVCACSSDVVEKLRADIARRTQVAERLRREALLRRTRVRARRQAEQDTAQGRAQDTAQGTAQGRAQGRAQDTEQDTAHMAASTKSERGPRREQADARGAQTPQMAPVRRACADRHRSAGANGIAGLVSRAEDGFRDAMKVCSLRAFRPTRSSYI